MTGQLPVKAAVSIDGKFPTSGSASTTYSCGNGNVGIEKIGGNLASTPIAGDRPAPTAGGLPVARGLAGSKLAPRC